MLRTLSLGLALVLPLSAQDQDPLVLDPGLHHLGDSKVEAWVEAGVPADPESNRLDLEFGARANTGEFVLELFQRDFDNAWWIELNGERIVDLKTGKAPVTNLYRLPAGALKDGNNELSIVPSRTSDDVIVGRIRLYRASLGEVLKLQQVDIAITDENGAALPSKITIARPDGSLVEVFGAERKLQATRPGIVYTGDGHATFLVGPGKYRIFASRGTEWSVAREDVTITDQGSDGIQNLAFSLRREVDTTGWISCDTHIHTLQFSGHGDSSAMERVVTLAAENLELAIATDHNHNTDYVPFQVEAGLQEWFTSVTGNEVTTPAGHMNAFPLDPNEDIPNHRLKDFVDLLKGIRQKGGKVVVLNHPRWPQIPTGPFGVFDLDRITGELPGQANLPFDGMELVNSTTEQRDPDYLLFDWFALRNRGYGITAIGTSDSHTVGDPVGQGRTYIRADDSDVSSIDVDAVARRILAGEHTVSLGILCDATVRDFYRGGSTVPATDRRVDVSLRVQTPSWVRAHTAKLYLNGREYAAREIENEDGKPLDTTLTFPVELPMHDAWIVCTVLGDPITEPFWPTLTPYTFASTNPIHCDVDGDRSYSHPYALAKDIVIEAGSETQAVHDLCRDVDEVVAVQVASILREQAYRGAKTPSEIRDAFARWVETLGPLGKRDLVNEYVRSRRPKSTD